SLSAYLSSATSADFGGVAAAVSAAPRRTPRRPTTINRPRAPTAATDGSSHGNWLFGVASTASLYSLTNTASTLSSPGVPPCSVAMSASDNRPITLPRRSAAVLQSHEKMSCLAQPHGQISSFIAF